jgi:hypothetical protein
MNIDYKNGTSELTEHKDAKEAVRHLARRLVEREGEIKDARLLTVGDEIEHAGRRYRLTEAGFKRLGGSGGLYELVRSDRTFLGLSE